MGTHLHIKGKAKSEFLLMIFLVQSIRLRICSEPRGKGPLRRRKPKQKSKLCSQSQSYNELHMFEVRHAGISSETTKLKDKMPLYKRTQQIKYS